MDKYAQALFAEIEVQKVELIMTIGDFSRVRWSVREARQKLGGWLRHKLNSTLPHFDERLSIYSSCNIYLGSQRL